MQVHRHQYMQCRMHPCKQHPPPLLQHSLLFVILIFYCVHFEWVNAGLRNIYNIQHPLHHCIEKTWHSCKFKRQVLSYGTLYTAYMDVEQHALKHGEWYIVCQLQIIESLDSKPLWMVKSQMLSTLSHESRFTPTSFTILTR